MDEKIPWYLNKSHWTNNHFIGVVASALIFASIITAIGSIWQFCNWKKQHEISIESEKQEQLFNKRSELFKRLIYIVKAREQNIWNVWDCRRKTDFQFRNQRLNADYGECSKYWEREQNFVSESSGLQYEILVYFGDHGLEMAQNIKNCHEILHDITYMIPRSQLLDAKRMEEIKNSNKSLTEEFNTIREEEEKKINEMTKKAYKEFNKNIKYLNHYLLGQPLSDVSSSKEDEYLSFYSEFQKDYGLDFEGDFLSGEQELYK